MAGFKLVGHVHGAPLSACIHPYIVPSSDGTALFVGDAVKSGGSAAVPVKLSEAGAYLPTVIQAAAGNTLRGVVVGFDVNMADLTLLNRAASTERIVLVADDPGCIFEATEDGVGGYLTADEVGENLDIAVGAGSTVTGASGMLLDSSDHKTATAQMRIVGLGTAPDNALGSTSTVFRVIINEHELKSTSGV